VVVPGLKKGAFIIGAKYGKGFVSCGRRRSRLVGAGRRSEWKAAVSDFRSAVETDVFMLMMNEKGMNRLLFHQVHSRRRCFSRCRPGGSLHPGRDRCRDDRGDPDLVAFARSVCGHFTQRRDAARRQRLEYELYGRKATNREILTTNIRAARSRRGVYGGAESLLEPEVDHGLKPVPQL